MNSRKSFQRFKVESLSTLYSTIQSPPSSPSSFTITTSWIGPLCKWSIFPPARRGIYLIRLSRQSHPRYKYICHLFNPTTAVRAEASQNPPPAIQEIYLTGWLQGGRRKSMSIDEEIKREEKRRGWWGRVSWEDDEEQDGLNSYSYVVCAVLILE